MIYLLEYYSTPLIINVYYQGFNEPKILTGSDVPNARFGTSLATLGDINFDGFNGNKISMINKNKISFNK